MEQWGEEIMGNDNTIQFDVLKSKKDLTKEILTQVYDSLKEKGYNPVNQMVGYLISGDPTYITNFNGARALVRKLERDEILEEVIKNYLGIK
ncbi:Uncharacterized protein conserved in bacteria [Clostridium tetanomorphum]|nr:Uncharacterized protein conserved in bacteria [Clostridium tetanomorphum]